MAMNNLGRVAMVHRGDYSPTYDYKPLDCCYHDGSTYFCKAATTGNAPPNATYWVMMSTSASTVDRDAAEAAALAAAGSASTAANQVTLAAAEVALAQGHATTAGDEATAAAGSASDAAGSASQAQAFAGNAELSAGAAASSATSAANSASAAATSAASVDGPGLYNAIATHDHSGSTGMGVRIDYAHLQGSPPCPYEVGDILTTINEASPAARWPGTVWAGVESGRFLVAAGTGYAAGATGGAATHSHGLYSGAALIGAISGHTESLAYALSYNGALTGSTYTVYGSTSDSNGTDRIFNTALGGSTDAGSSLPPYYAVYMWRRTA